MAQSSNSNQRDAIIGWTLLGVLVAVLALLLLYTVPCSGFSACTTTSQSVSEVNGNITTVTTTETEPAKTFWNWLQLLVVPGALAALALLFERRMRRNEIELSDQRAAQESEHQIDQAREATLQAYLKEMANLLLQQDLRNSETNDEVRKIARVLTLTALRRLDGRRNGIVLSFLSDADLVALNEGSSLVLYADDLVGIDLSYADLYLGSLRGYDLTRANLHGANLSRSGAQKLRLNHANLEEANLAHARIPQADLAQVNLRGANLREIWLHGAFLNGADLREADLYHARLHKAYLKDANLSNANLSLAELNNADLTDANLSGANLSHASLFGAILKNTNLEGAIVTGTLLDKTSVDL